MQAIYLSGLTKAVYILFGVCVFGLMPLFLRFLDHTQLDTHTSERVINSSQSPHTIHLCSSTVKIVLSGISEGKGLSDTAIFRISEC